MGDTERPIPERLGDQDEQAQHLARTGNGPTVGGEDEQRLLAEQYGAPDMAGVYSGPALTADSDEAAGDGDQVDAEPAAVEGDTAAANTAEGGEQA